MSYSINDTIEFQLTWQSTKWTGQKWRNNLCYRVIAGELPYESADQIVSTFQSTVLDRIVGQHLESTYLKSIRLISRNRVTLPEWVLTNDGQEVSGALIDDVDDVAQASACITRYTWSRGRKSIGRYFHGPLSQRFVNGGESVEDPPLIGDLGDVCDALGDPLVVSGWQARPVVIGGSATTSTQQNEVRTNRLAPLITYLKSRRVGKGE